MEASGVKRLIRVTGLGAGDSRGRGGILYNAALCLFLGRLYADKDVQERIIRKSRLDWFRRDTWRCCRSGSSGARSRLLVVRCEVQAYGTLPTAATAFIKPSTPNGFSTRRTSANLAGNCLHCS